MIDPRALEYAKNALYGIEPKPGDRGLYLFALNNFEQTLAAFAEEQQAAQPKPNPAAGKTAEEIEAGADTPASGGARSPARQI